MRTETIFVVISFLCFFLAINLAVFSVYAITAEMLREQAVAMATSFFVGGAVIAVLLIILKIVAKAYSGTRSAKPRVKAASKPSP